MRKLRWKREDIQTYEDRNHSSPSAALLRSKTSQSHHRIYHPIRSGLKIIFVRETIIQFQLIPISLIPLHNLPHHITSIIYLGVGFHSYKFITKLFKCREDNSLVRGGQKVRYIPKDQKIVSYALHLFYAVSLNYFTELMSKIGHPFLNYSFHLILSHLWIWIQITYSKLHFDNNL
jgi:hypothetical protein